MKRLLLGCLLLTGIGLSAQAGSVATISNGSEVTGKVSLSPNGIHVDTGSSPVDIAFTDVLAANFSDAPLQLDTFYGGQEADKALPASWRGQDIGTVGTPGSVTATGGAFTLHGSGATAKPGDTGGTDHLFFVGRPWTGDGEWTARVREMDPATPDTIAGLMLRATLEAGSPLYLLEANGQSSGIAALRADAGKAMQAAATSVDLPAWLRITRFGSTCYAATSADGLDWNYVWQSDFSAPSFIAGLFADSHKDKVLGTAVIDQVTFTPPPSTAQLLPSGVLLQSGTFLAGSFNSFAGHPAKAITNPSFNLDGKPLEIPIAKMAAVTILPTTRTQLASMGTQVGLVMKNGDFLEGIPESISGSSVEVSSIALGLTTYNQAEVRACVLHPVVEPTGDYEVRLRNGSIIFATSVSGGKDAAVIQEASGLTINVTGDELAEFRAGPTATQSLAQLDWKVVGPPTATPAAVPGAPAAPAAAAPSPDAPVVTDQLQPVQCWSGHDGEQIIQAPMRTPVQFTITGHFHAVAMRVAVSPNSPPHTSLAVRILADGRELTTTSPLRMGDAPLFLTVPFQAAQTLTLLADSPTSNARVVFLDPVLLRDKAP